SGDERVFECHRGDMSVVFCDLREFTRFAEATAPEEVMAALREYHQSLDGRIHRRGGTLDRFSGDGLMVPFNDPPPCPDPSMKAMRMAVEMRDVVAKLHYGPELGSDRHRARGCHPRADRLRGPIRLFRHWEPWSISRRDYVRKPSPDRSSWTLKSSRRSWSMPRWTARESSRSRGSPVRSPHMTFALCASTMAAQSDADAGSRHRLPD